LSTVNAQNFGDGTDSVPASAVIEGTAKAWITYAQTTSTTDDSFNVSSLTDSGGGDATVNQTNNSATSNFDVNLTSDTVNPRVEYTNMSTSSWRPLTYDTSNNLIDSQSHTSRMGDLA